MPVQQNFISKDNVKILWNMFVLVQGNFYDLTQNNQYVHFFNILIYLFFRIPEASSLMLNIILSDTIFNVFRDHNFDSCTICVCSNEGNIRGRDAAPYLPNFQGDDDSNCICGFSALSNRKLAHQSGLFYEVRKIRIHTDLSKVFTHNAHRWRCSRVKIFRFLIWLIYLYVTIYA